MSLQYLVDNRSTEPTVVRLETETIESFKAKLTFNK